MNLITIIFMLFIGPFVKDAKYRVPTVPDEHPTYKVMTTSNKDAVTAVINQYFKGIETGDTVLLRQTFHPDALLFGDINGTPYFKTGNAYLSGVANRVSPDKSGQPFEAEILSVDVINSIATAKLHVKMYTFNYYNFLTLHETNGHWQIVNKTLTNLIE